MIDKEDQTAPISQACITEAITRASADDKARLIREIIDYMNQKRDAYNGIVTSIIYVIDCGDTIFLQELFQQILSLLLSVPPRYASKIFLTKALHRLTRERPGFVAELFHQLIQNLQNSIDRGYENALRLKVLAIKSIRQSELQARINLVSLDKSFINDICFEAVDKGDNPTKLDALYFALDTNMTAQVLEHDQFKIYLSVFDHALAFTEPSLRQIFLSISNKLFKRVKDSHRAATRKEQSQASSAATQKLYENFIECLIRQCFSEIYCGAHFGSLNIVTSIILQIIEHISLESEGLPIKRLLSNEVYYNSLLSCINDPYEESKAACLKLLINMPFHTEIHSKSTIQQLNKVAYHLVSSVNQAHSLTCEYVFRLIIDYEMREELHEKGKDCASQNDIIFKHLSKLIELLESAVIETKLNFILALKNNSIYPKLTCIRALLELVKIEELELRQKDWKHLLVKIVHNSIEACHAVSGIVCNLNPETIGHLPMDLEPIDVDNLATNLSMNLRISNDDVKTITSQMLLISGWKTIKECSLAMGVLSTRFWWPKERIRIKLEKYPGFSFPSLIESSQMCEIIAYFDHFLRNLRHRGAFEQAYNGYSMVTKRVWHDKELQHLLLATLKDIISDFKLIDDQPGERDDKIEHLKAYVTRRSAGIPFIFQSILSAEFKQESKTLDWAMSSLFEVLDDDKSETYQKIHCLNILRALMKEHHLGEKVLPYIGKTFAIIMDAFNSNSFPIRNCANMLLKSTVDRTFGINRLRDTIHSRNKLSFDKFFSECPNLHAKMLQILEDMRPTTLASIHSVFIVMSRLRVARSTDLQIIRPFVDPLKKIALRCPDFKLREIASELCVRLESISANLSDGLAIRHTLDQIEQSMYDSDNKTLRTSCKNQLHGNLLLIKGWIKVFVKHECEISAEGQQAITTFAIQVVRDILAHGEAIKLQEKFAWASLQCAALDIVETENLVSETHNYHNGWLPILISSAKHELYRKFDNQSLKQPHYEQYLFKIITSVLMNLGRLTDSQLEKHLADIEVVNELIAHSFDGPCSVQLKSAISRLLVQLDEGFIDGNENHGAEDIAIDFSANFVTPFEKLDRARENDFESQLWRCFCLINRLLLSKITVKPPKVYRSCGTQISSKPRYPVRYLDSLAEFCCAISTLVLNGESVELNTGCRSMRGISEYLASVSDSVSNGHRKVGKCTSIVIPESIMQQLKPIRSSDLDTSDTIGDYSWILRTNEVRKDSHDLKRDCSSLFFILVSELQDDLSYFESSYWNMLTDTRYYSKEMGLLKRVIFLRQVSHLAEHKQSASINESLSKLQRFSVQTGVLQECERHIRYIITS